MRIHFRSNGQMVYSFIADGENSVIFLSVTAILYIMSFRSWFANLKIPPLLFDKSGSSLISALEKNIYGKSNATDVVFFDSHCFFFRPTSLKDHLATKFLQVPSQKKEKKPRSILVRLGFSKSSASTSRCCIDIQDDQFSFIGRIDCEKILSNKNFLNIQFSFDLPDISQSFRLVFISNKGDVVCLPNSIQIGNGNLDENEFSIIKASDPFTFTVLNIENEIDNLQFLPECELVKKIVNYSADEVQKHYFYDPWILNYLMNNWEFAAKKTTLSSYPYDVAFAISGNCNSNCIFCITKDLRMKYKNRFMGVNDWERFRDLLKYSRSIGIPGPGEPLLHPQFEQLISNLACYCDKRCNVYMITNGTLIRKHLDFLKTSIISTYDISLNAATKETYERVMGTRKDNFDRIIDNIHSLVEIRDNENKNIKIYITFVTINENCHELSDFIRLGNNLNVDGIFIRPYVIESSKQCTSTPTSDILNPYSNPRFNESLSQFKKNKKHSQVPVFAQPDLWNIHKENTAPHPCNLLYNKLYLHNDFFKIWPCCIIGDLGDIHPIDCEDQENFFLAWNSPTMEKLRKSMFEGPLNECCSTCNIDLNI